MSRQYYQFSGNLPVRRTVTAMLGSLLTGILLGGCYGWIILYAPYVGHFSMFVALGFGGLLGVLTGQWFRWALLHNRVLFVAAGAIAAVVAWYTGWAVWSWILVRQADHGVKLWAVFFQPRVVWDVVCSINKDGLWTFHDFTSGRDFTPTGIVLWGYWLVEAVVMIGLPVYIIAKMATDDPCCERCQCWCERNGSLKVALTDTTEFKRRLEAHDLGYISQFRPPVAGAGQWVRLQLHSCPKCHELHILTAKVAMDTTDIAKACTVKTETFMDRLLVSSPVAKALRDIEAKWDAAEPQPV